MAISNKTRKILWARSGNRCLLCRIELVQEQPEANVNLIIGEECHIVSSKKAGPRGDMDIAIDFDDYDNLMLLCANDHKRVDELTEIYTMEQLLLFKLLHENWVKTTLEKDASAFVNDQTHVKSLAKISTGKELLNIVDGVHLFNLDHDEAASSDEAELLGAFLEGIQDWGDILSEIGYGVKVNLGFEYNQHIQELNSKGFIVFGLRRKMKLRNDENKDMGVYDAASILVLRNDNPAIIGDFVIAKFPSHFNFS